MQVRVFCIVMFLVVSATCFGQECWVNDAKINKTYEGGCKSGKAEGKGVAKGEDRYEGEFKKGMKEGEGTYYFSNGDVYKGGFRKDQRYGYGELIVANNAGSDSSSAKVIKGYWKGETYVGENKAALSGYEIIVSTNTPKRPLFNKIGEGKNVSIDVRDINRSVSGFRISEYSSGQVGDLNTPNGGATITMYNVSFPFQATIEYSVPNKANSFTLPVQIRFVIYESGVWKISVIHD